MKVQAYRCDFCGMIKEEKYIVGINPLEDLFEKIKSFPIMSNPEKTNVHICTNCTRENAAVPAANQVNRKKNESEYKAKYEELSFILRSQCVHNVRSGKVFKIDA